MDDDVLSAADHAAVLRRRWRIVATCTLLGIAVAVVMSMMQTSIFASQATVILRDQLATTDGSGTLDSSEVATQGQVVVSDPVVRRVRSKLGLQESPERLRDAVTVEPIEDQRVLSISVTDDSAQGAANLANAFAQEYLDLRAERAASARAAMQQGSLDDLTSLETRILALRAQLETAGPTDAVRMQGELAGLRTLQTQLQATLLASQDLVDSGTSPGELLKRASAAPQPISPRPLKAALIGLVAGLVAGLAAAYVRDRSDDKVRDADQLYGVLDEVPLLAEITMSAPRKRSEAAPHGGTSPPAVEAYRLLATDLRALAPRSEAEDGRSGLVVMVSSAVRGEGKTTLAANLAVAAARTGSRVILVDADLRQGDVAARFALDDAPGLSDVTAERPSVSLLREVGVRNLLVLGAGRSRTNPEELITLPCASAVIADLRKRADLVVVDTAGILECADALQLADVVDHVVVATRAGTSRSKATREVLERHRRAGRASLSAVLIHFDIRRGHASITSGDGTVGDEKSRTRHRIGRSGSFRNDVPVRPDQ